MPCIKLENAVPQKLIVFSKAVCAKDFHGFVHFFEDDVNFERIWNTPNRYLPILKNSMGLLPLTLAYTVICRLLCKSGTPIEAEQLGIGCRKTGSLLFLISDLLMNAHIHFVVTAFLKVEPLLLGLMGALKLRLNECILRKALAKS